MSGALLARVQQVHSHPLQFSNGLCRIYVSLGQYCGKDVGFELSKFEVFKNAQI